VTAGRKPAPLGPRALNRALLARQLLLERARMPALAAVGHLVGLQAQAPDAPYVGLWTRLEGFDPDELAVLLADRRAVRTHAMRWTIHLLSADDGRSLRPLFDGMLRRRFSATPFARAIQGIDEGALRAAARELLSERPLTRVELGDELAARFPGRDATSLAYAAATLEPSVQTPPRGIWRRPGPATWMSIDAWLGAGAAPALTLDDLVLRYLAAFGPATVADIRTWSGLSGLRDVVERLRPGLSAFRDEAGRERLDLPDAPRPDPETPAPPRFLPEYDNVLLSHADRSHIRPARRSVPLPPGDGGRVGTVLVDGFYRADWRLAVASDGGATLHVEPFTPLTGAEAADVAAEGERLLGLVAPDARRAAVRLAPD